MLQRLKTNHYQHRLTGSFIVIRLRHSKCSVKIFIHMLKMVNSIGTGGNALSIEQLKLYIDAE